MYPPSVLFLETSFIRKREIVVRARTDCNFLFCFLFLSLFFSFFIFQMAVCKIKRHCIHLKKHVSEHEDVYLNFSNVLFARYIIYMHMSDTCIGIYIYMYIGITIKRSFENRKVSA